MRAVKATDRTLAALRKADRLPTNIPGGKMRKGMYPGGFGGAGVTAYNGMFAVLDITDYSVDPPIYQLRILPGIVQVNRVFQIYAGGDINLPSFAYGEMPDDGYVVLEIEQNSDTLAITITLDVVNEGAATTSLGLHEGRVIIATATATEDTEAETSGRINIVQAQHGAAVCLIWGECPEEE